MSLALEALTIAATPTAKVRLVIGGLCCVQAHDVACCSAALLGWMLLSACALTAPVSSLVVGATPQRLTPVSAFLVAASLVVGNSNASVVVGGWRGAQAQTTVTPDLLLVVGIAYNHMTLLAILLLSWVESCFLLVLWPRQSCCWWLVLHHNS